MRPSEAATRRSGGVEMGTVAMRRKAGVAASVRLGNSLLYYPLRTLWGGQGGDALPRQIASPATPAPQSRHEQDGNTQEVLKEVSGCSSGRRHSASAPDSVAGYTRSATLGRGLISLAARGDEEVECWC